MYLNITIHIIYHINYGISEIKELSFFFKKDLSREVKKYLALNGNENTAYQDSERAQHC